MSYQAELTHLIRLASDLPAWKAYAWSKAQHLQTSGQHPGIADALKAHMVGLSKTGDQLKGSSIEQNKAGG